MARKTNKTNAPTVEAPEARTEVGEAEWKEEHEDSEPELPRRKDLLVEAIRIVRGAMKKEATPSRTTVGNLVQLLKLHKEIVSEEEKPAQIQLIWNELDEDLYESD